VRRACAPRAAPIGGRRSPTPWKPLGGKLECLYFAFGDVFSIVDLPDDEAAAAVSLIANASGGATVRTTVLLTPEQVDEAAGRAVTYRPPGL
jgi:uncharacterized protein with GYD domain